MLRDYCYPRLLFWINIHYESHSKEISLQIFKLLKRYTQIRYIILNGTSLLTFFSLVFNWAQPIILQAAVIWLIFTIFPKPKVKVEESLSLFSLSQDHWLVKQHADILRKNGKEPTKHWIMQVVLQCFYGIFVWKWKPAYFICWVTIKY